MQGDIVHGIPRAWIDAEMQVLAAFRRFAGVSSEAVATRAGISRPTLSRIETGVGLPPSRKVLEAYVACLFPHLWRVSEYLPFNAGILDKELRKEADDES